MREHVDTVLVSTCSWIVTQSLSYHWNDGRLPLIEQRGETVKEHLIVRLIVGLMNLSLQGYMLLTSFRS